MDTSDRRRIGRRRIHGGGQTAQCQESASRFSGAGRGGGRKGGREGGTKGGRRRGIGVRRRWEGIRGEIIIGSKWRRRRISGLDVDCVTAVYRAVSWRAGPR